VLSAKEGGGMGGDGQPNAGGKEDRGLSVLGKKTDIAYWGDGAGISRKARLLGGEGGGGNSFLLPGERGEQIVSFLRRGVRLGRD